MKSKNILNSAISIFLTVAIMLSLRGGLVVQASAADYSGICGTNLIWELDMSTGTLTISGDGEMWHYDGVNHRAPWYSYRNDIRNLTLENNITIIGCRAFEGCCSLTGNLTLPNSLTTIGDNAFSGCSGFSGNLTLPNSLTTIGVNAFSGCSGFTGNLTLPNSLTTIGGNVFSGCSGFTGNLTLPNSLTTIGGNAFSGCSGFIGNLTLPNSLIKINYGAFRGCNGFTGNLTFPNSLTTIGGVAFDGCSGFTGNLTLPNSLTSISNHAFRGCSGFNGNLTLPNRLTAIWSSAFEGCSGFTGNLALPNSLTMIEDHAFRGCSGFNGNLTLPNRLTAIWGNAFEGCSGFTGNLTLPNSLTTIACYAFKGCSSLTGNLTLPNSLTTIGGNSFDGCNGFTGNLTLPNSLTTIENQTFSGCSGFTGNLTLPNSLTTIDSGAFSGCSGFNGNLTLPNSLTTIGWNAFYGCSGLTGNLTLPNSLTTIDTGTFRGCSGFTGNLTLPNSLTTIGDNAFSGCSGFTGNLTLPNSLTSINYGAFIGCSGFTGKLTLPNSLTTIGCYAFEGCSSLTGELTLPNSLTTIGGYAFYGCSDFTGNLTLPNSLTTIDSDAFSGCSGFTGNLTLPNSLTTIGGNVFSGCSGFTGNLTLPNSLTTIGGNAFSGCSGFTGNLTLPNSLTTIGGGAFRGCSGFTGNLTLPNSLKTINRGAFEGCSSLTGNLTLPNNLTTIDSDAFSGCSGFTGNLTLPNSLTTIRSYAFYGCSGFTGNLKLPNSLTTIGNYAFYECSGFTGNLTLPNSLTTINECSFYGCSGFTSNLTLPNSLTTIEWSAFSGCRSLMCATFLGNAPSVESYVFDNCAPGFFIRFNPSTSGWTTPTWAGYKAISIENENSSIHSLATKNLSLTIYESENEGDNKYKLSKGAVVTDSNTCFTADKNGRVFLPTPKSGTISISKNGYVTRTLTVEQAITNPTIYLQKASGAPVINALWVDNDKDVVNGTYGIDLLSERVLQLSADIDWQGNYANRVVLRQGAKGITFSGTTISTRLSDNFDVGKPIYIIATAANGKETRKELGFVRRGGENQALSGYGVDFEDKIELTLPNNIPFFGGETIKAGIYNDIPVTVEIDNGKVYMAIGARLDAEKKNGKWGVKDFTSSLKEARKYSDKLRNFKNTYKNHLKSGKGSFGFDAGFAVMGFYEGYIDSNGNLVELDSGLVVEVSAEAKRSWPFTLGPVPMFVEGKISGEIKAQLNLKINEAVKQFMPNGTINGELELSGGLGLGISKVASVSGGLQGKLTPTWEIICNDTDYFKLMASLSVYAKVQIAFFEYTHTVGPIAEAMWAEYPSSGNLTLSALEDVPIYDTSVYTLSGRNYLDKPSEFLANDGDLSLMDSAGTSRTTTIVSNAYPQTQPQLANFSDGTRLAVWIGDESTRSSTNRTALYYSYYSGSTWSTPAIVNNDGTADLAPQLIVENNVAYLVWQDAATTFSETAKLEEMAPQMDISLAVFDKPNGTFACKKITNPNIDLMPTLCASGSAVNIVWINNNQNDWFGANSSNSIMSSSYNGTDWAEPKTLYSGLNSISSISADCTGGVLSLAYCVDGDNNLNNITDTELYLNGTRISTNTVQDTGATFKSGTLYWYSNGNISKIDDLESKQITTLFKEATMPTDSFDVMDTETGKALLYTQGEGLFSTLKAVFFDSAKGTWSEPVELTDGKAYISNFSAKLANDGKIVVLLNQMAVNGKITDANPYGQTNLVMLEVTMHSDISVGKIYANRQEYVVGNTLPLEFTITNNGELTASNCQIEILDSNDTVIFTQLFGKPILPGQTVEATTYYYVESVSPQTVLKVKISQTGSTDTNMTDNIASVTLSYIDAAVENMSCGKTAENKAVVYADVVNRGYAPLSNLTITLHEDTKDGKIVETQTISTLEPLAVKAVSFNVTNSTDKLYFATLEGCADDMMIGNNTDVVVFAENKIVKVDLVTMDSNKICVNLKNNPTCKLIVAAYDEKGKMLTSGTQNSKENAGFVELKVPGYSNTAVKTLKVFFLDEAKGLSPIIKEEILTI